VLIINNAKCYKKNSALAHVYIFIFVFHYARETYLACIKEIKEKIIIKETFSRYTFNLDNDYENKKLLIKHRE